MNKTKYRIFSADRDKINFSSRLVVQSDEKFDKEDTVIFIDNGVPDYARRVISQALNYILLDELYRPVPHINPDGDVMLSLYSISCQSIENYIKRVNISIYRQICVRWCQINSFDFTIENCSKWPILILWEGPR